MSTEVIAQKKITEQERFYYDKYAFVILILSLLIILSVGLGGLIFLLRSSAVPPPTYFSATKFNELIEPVPLEQPNIRTNVLLNWISEAMMTANTFNFINYSKVIDAASVYFTKEGFSSYQEALNANKVIEQVLQRKLILKAMPTDAPQILLEKPFAGRYMWKIKIPMQFKYQSVAFNGSTHVDITLIVMRVPTIQSANGVSILKFDIDHSDRLR